jgi:hypothetical protein
MRKVCSVQVIHELLSESMSEVHYISTMLILGCATHLQQYIACAPGECGKNLHHNQVSFLDDVFECRLDSSNALVRFET